MASKNTLFAYFKKIDGDDKSVKNKSTEKLEVSPASKPASIKKQRKDPNKSLQCNKNCNSKQNPSKNEAQQRSMKKRSRKAHSSDDEETTTKKKPKRKRIICDESFEDEWKPKAKSESELSEEEVESTESENDYEHSEESEDEETEKVTKHNNKKAGKKVSLPATKQDKLVPHAPAAIVEERKWAHLSYDFLQPEKIRDAKKRRPDHPDYNPRTLFVPPNFLQSLTPAMRQWWDIKSQNFDCVIFLKLGKFYELYHMDAAIGVNELGLIFMKHPDVAHSGFPEAGYARYSKVLVEKGYKVARVEQTETPEMMQSRCKQMCAPTKFDKVVKREVCQITSKGTRMYLAIEGDATTSDNAYLLAITEKKIVHGSDERTEFGICFMDTSLGSICIGQFDDDRHKSELRTLLAHYPPAHVLLKKSVCEETRNIVNCMAATALIDYLAPDVEFLNAAETLKTIHESDYFGKRDENEATEWPETLVEATDFKDLWTPKSDSELALSAFGACLWFLRKSKLDLQVLCTKNIKPYTPHCGQAPANPRANLQSVHMVLDATTLANLDVVSNADTGNKENTLLEKIDNCCTPFGRRLLRQWLCSPLCSVSAIVKRQKAVTCLMNMPSECDKARKLMKELPDIERLLMRIAVYGNVSSATKHPDSRAIFYEDFSKKKIENLLSLLKGFKDSLAVVKLFKGLLEHDCDPQSCDSPECSALLKQITHTNAEQPMGKFPEMKHILDFFENAFDPKEALNTGKLTPRKGADPEFEAFEEKFQEINTELKLHLKDAKRIFGCDAKYVGTDKKRFQIEVPENLAKKAPSNFELTSSRKGFKRFYSPECKVLLAKLQAAEEEKKEHLLDINRRMFARFAASADTWIAAMKCIATLDVLLSIAKYGAAEATCMPKIKTPTKELPSFINIVDGRLPTTTLSDFIPNNTSVGSNGIHLLLLSGPNMGGKSTLMRQMGLIVILAQIGCPVPAEDCTLTPADRIFTRIGAKDNILAGESTFFVEMSETASILKHATRHSLVFVDELGRGTTTFDGAAIASAVLENLIEKQCSTVFSTHYHFLVEKYDKCPRVALMHMACLEEEAECSEAKVETVTFLYKLTPGACPSSHGFNAARLAGLPMALVLTAKQQALKLQSYPKKVDIFQKLLKVKCNEENKLKSLVHLFNDISKLNC